MEKYLIFLITIIVIIIVIYCLFCNQIDTKDTFTTVLPSVTGIDDNNAINILAAIARDLKTSTGVTIPGNLSVQDLQVNGVSNLTPKGGIIAWKFSSTNIVNGVLIPPPTWALCDGQNGTPDLKGRFILGGGHGTGLTSRLPDATGGAETVTLTEAQMPSHSHNYALVNAPWPPGDHGGRSQNVWRGAQTAATTPTGGNQPHENMPPFYVLAYIMKL
jgi:microcystin-dependent protein